MDEEVKVDEDDNGSSSLLKSPNRINSDIYVINRSNQTKYNLLRVVYNITICLLIVLITPITLSRHGYQFWFFSFRNTLFDLWLISSSLALAITTLAFYQCQQYVLIIMFALYGCFSIPKGIFYEKYSDHQYVNLVCFCILITLTMSLFLVSIIFHEGSKQADVIRNELRERLLDIEESQSNAVDPPAVATKAHQKMFGWAMLEWKLLLIGAVSLIVASCCSLAQPYYFG